MTYREAQAAAYDGDGEHALPPEEAAVWLDEMDRFAPQSRGDLLDIGAGTGFLTAVMKRAGFRVTGLEPSTHMIRSGLSRDPDLEPKDFVVGSAEQADLFADGAFDWIVSRQVLCHLTKPAQAFSAWHRWLKPGGCLLLVDGFWPRTSWSDVQIEAQPFAALVGTRPVADALSDAGFAVIRAGPFAALNKARAARHPASVTRYLVAACRRRRATSTLE